MITNNQVEMIIKETYCEVKFLYFPGESKINEISQWEEKVCRTEIPTQDLPNMKR